MILARFRVQENSLMATYIGLDSVLWKVICQRKIDDILQFERYKFDWGISLFTNWGVRSRIKTAFLTLEPLIGALWFCWGLERSSNYDVYQSRLFFLSEIRICLLKQILKYKNRKRKNRERVRTDIQRRFFDQSLLNLNNYNFNDGIVGDKFNFS